MYSSSVLEFEPVEICFHVFVIGDSVVVEDMVAPFFVIGTTQITKQMICSRTWTMCEVSNSANSVNPLPVTSRRDVSQRGRGKDHP